MEEKKKIDWDWKILERSYVFFIGAAFIWWTMFLMYRSSVPMLEKANDKLHSQVMELRNIDREKCVDLLLNDKI